MFKQTLKLPNSFIREFNLKNINIFIKAIRNESPKLIVRNFKQLLILSNEDFANDHDALINDYLITSEKYINKHLSPEKKIIFFVSHEATITGAPLIILKIAESFKKNYDVIPLFICLKYGDLLEKFEKLAPTYLTNNKSDAAQIEYIITNIVSTLKKTYSIDNVLINSAESIITFKAFKKQVKNVIGLIHESGSLYPVNSWKQINKYSDHIIFPSNFVKDNAILNSNFDDNKILIKGQGLLKPELLDLNKTEQAAILKKKHHLPANSKIVLGCGQLIARKGFDLFSYTAIAVSNLRENIYFIWLGEAPFNEYQTWVEFDIKNAGKNDKVIFTGQLKDTSSYFAGSDLFFLTSRGDPFPCVVQEAMACSMPVFGFENAGGFVELVDDSNGEIIPYADINKAANSIVNLFDDEELLNKKSKQSRNKINNRYHFKNYVSYIWKLIS